MRNTKLLDETDKEINKSKEKHFSFIIKLSHFLVQLIDI